MVYVPCASTTTLISDAFGKEGILLLVDVEGMGWGNKDGQLLACSKNFLIEVTVLTEMISSLTSLFSFFGGFEVDLAH